VDLITPLSNDEDRVDAYHNNEPLWYRTMEDILGEQPMPRLVPHDLEVELHLAHDDNEPRSFTEVEEHVD